MDGVNRPNRSTSSEDEVWHYIVYLESKLEGYTRNGGVTFVKSLNNKLIDLAAQIDDAEIRFDSKQDKIYDRFLATCKAGLSIASDMKSFLQEYGEQIKEDEKKAGNIMESYARKTK